MNEVKVKREELLAKLKSNRAEHRDLFLKAQDGYRKAVIEELDRMLADTRSGKQIRRHLSLPEPMDHTDDYDNIICMMEMSVDPIIELDQHDFKRYVMDDWEWKLSDRATNAMYVSRA